MEITKAKLSPVVDGEVDVSSITDNYDTVFNFIIITQDGKYVVKRKVLRVEMHKIVQDGQAEMGYDVQKRGLLGTGIPKKYKKVLILYQITVDTPEE